MLVNIQMGLEEQGEESFSSFALPEACRQDVILQDALKMCTVPKWTICGCCTSQGQSAGGSSAACHFAGLVCVCV